MQAGRKRKCLLAKTTAQAIGSEIGDGLKRREDVRIVEPTYAGQDGPGGL